MLFGGTIMLVVTVLFSVVFPVGLMIWWKRRTGEKIWSFLVGAAGFILFAMVLENLLHMVCLVNDNAVSRVLMASPVLYTLYAAFAAGIFEETGRLFCYKVLLRKNSRSSCAAAYGIGHGGAEVMILLGANYLVLLLALMGVSFGDEAVNAQLLATANGIPAAAACIAMFERVSAMMIQIGLSMLVFVAAREKKYFWLYPTAIMIHALVDAPAALYQYHVLTSLAVVEGVALAAGILCLIFGNRMMKKRESAA